jgi:hypothetical protein
MVDTLSLLGGVLPAEEITRFEGEFRQQAKGGMLDLEGFKKVSLLCKRFLRAYHPRVSRCPSVMAASPLSTTDMVPHSQEAVFSSRVV